MLCENLTGFPDNMPGHQWSNLELDALYYLSHSGRLVCNRTVVPRIAFYIVFSLRVRYMFLSQCKTWRSITLQRRDVDDIRSNV